MALPCASPLLNLKPNSRRYSQAHFCFLNNLNPPGIRSPFRPSSQSSSFPANARGFSMPSLRFALKPNFMKVKAASGESESFNSERTQQEVFAWSSVILPPSKTAMLDYTTCNEFVVFSIVWVTFPMTTLATIICAAVPTLSLIVFALLKQHLW